MGKKWYEFFLTVESASERPAESSATAASAAQKVAEIAAAVAPQPQFTAPLAGAGSFEEIYRAAEIQPPPHGYTILKVAEMLASEHIRELPAEVKRKSVLLALEAAGVKLQEVIEDAVRRDRALDGYERVLEKHLAELEARKTEENRRWEAELEKLIAE